VKTPTILVSTWEDGLFAVSGNQRTQEIAAQPVRGLTSDGRGGALAIVGGHSLQRRRSGGEWSTLAASEFDLSSCMAVGDRLYVGTDDARMLQLNAEGLFEPLVGFDTVAGRETWFAGSAMVNGVRMGPPLGIRSVSATPDGSVLFANVHVGGIPRSLDSGRTWEPTIAVLSDVHEVRAHPIYPGIVAAASAVGLCLSRDFGATWTIEADGLHAPHCSAVAFSGDDVFISASTDPFTRDGRIYRRPLSSEAPLEAVEGGLPLWLEGSPDTGCMATMGSLMAIADRAGNLYVSEDFGREWACVTRGLPMPGGVFLCGEP